MGSSPSLLAECSLTLDAVLPLLQESLLPSSPLTYHLPSYLLPTLTRSPPPAQPSESLSSQWAPLTLLGTLLLTRLGLSPFTYFIHIGLPSFILSSSLGKQRDHIKDLPKSRGFDSIFVIINKLSKYGNFLSLKHPFFAKNVAHIFLKEVVHLHGFPHSIVSDRGIIFKSQFWKELNKNHGTELRMNSSYHPQTDGHTEAVNRGIECYMSCFAAEKLKKGIDWLHGADLSCNSSYSSAIKTSPFKVADGRDPPVL